MQAILFDRYGPPEVLQLRERPDPRPRSQEVLIRVRAAGLNPIDWRIRNGSLRFLLPSRFPRGLGFDVAGTVAAVGSKASQFQVGDEVLAFLEMRTSGGYAELVSAAEKVVVRKPPSLSFEEAAALPLAASTALQSLRDQGRIQAGSEVLINGASGGVGTFAVQLAKILGAGRVIGVCSGKNEEFVKELGADEVIDYQQDDFTLQQLQLDIILDAVAFSSFRRCKRLLKRRGTYITTVPSPLDVLRHGVTRLGRRCRFVLARPRQEDLQTLAAYCEEGKLRPVVDRTFPLAEAAVAHQYLELHHARGKVVLAL